MESVDTLLALAALGQPTRLEAFRLLVRHEPDGVAAGDIAKALAVPQNTMSTHLAVLSRAGLISAQRASRSIIYRADLSRFRAVMLFMLRDCCDGRPDVCAPLIEDLTPCCSPRPQDAKGKSASERVYNVLFLCTGNSARSILAEAILRKDGEGRFRAFSAGSEPNRVIDPVAIRMLEKLEYPTDDLRPKSWKEFAATDAPAMDFVFTVCDDVADETCPVWPSQPVLAHWGIKDPTKTIGSDIEKEAAFFAAFRFLKNRIGLFTDLPLASIDRLSLGTKLREIGRIQGATSGQDRAG